MIDVAGGLKSRLFIVEGTHDIIARDHFFHMGIQLADSLLLPFEKPPCGLGDPFHRQSADRDHDEKDQGQFPVCDEHHKQDSDDRQQLGKKSGKVRLDHVRQRHHITCEAR